MTTFLQEKQEKMQTFYCCKQCDFNTSNKYNYEKHLSNSKTSKYNQIQQKYNKYARYNAFYQNCTFVSVVNLYRHRASLYNHKKKCLYNKLSTVECDLSKNVV